MDFIKLTQNKLSVDEALESVTASNCGAVSLFVGTTRDNFEGKKVLNLEYEAYEGMAEKTMKQICNDMREKWKTIENIAIYHRLGKVPVKESSVIIAISSPHRKDALEATQWCIDTLKQSVPIWKKEIYEDSDSKWKENSECTWSNLQNKINKNKFVFEPRVECTNISNHLIQINCSNEEIDRRINTFMQSKREHINMSNIRDFCGNIENNCARVDSKLIRPKNTKSHLRSQRVYNDLGPYNIQKLQKHQQESPYISHAIDRRIGDIEHNLNLIKPVSPDIYERIKKIEDRILFLESVSPEYVHFWNKESVFLQNEETPASVKKQTFSLEYVDNLLYELEKQTHIKSSY